jgi:HSP20 family protein
MTRLSIFRPRNSHELKPFFDERDAFIRSFDSMFDDMLNTTFPTIKDMGVSVTKGAYPKVNIVSHDDKVEIVAELAGFSKNDINLEIEEGLLTISGKAPEQDGCGCKEDPCNCTNTGGATYYLRELKRSSFKRSFKINDNLDMESVVASFDNGLLTINLPRVPEEVKLAKKVTIK